MKNPNDDIEKSEGCLSNEIGTKGRFSILTNPKGDVLLVTDAREGEPDDLRFIYDGGDTALLFRSFKSNVAIRGVDEKAREPLKSVNRIQIDQKM